MSFPDRSDGPTRRLRDPGNPRLEKQKNGVVKLYWDRPFPDRAKTRIYTGPRKALRT